jgi:bilirubin oxidase
MPLDSVKFITKFEDFSNDSIPYMYHCHLLHHEDDGMMGSFLVLEYPLSTVDVSSENNFSIYPNPSSNYWIVKANDNSEISNYKLSTIDGRSINYISSDKNRSKLIIQNSALPNGQYILTIHSKNSSQTFKLIKD